MTHICSPGRHEDGEVGEVIAGTAGCVAADVDGLAAVSGPATLQAVHLILPEGALCHVKLHVDRLERQKRAKTAVKTAGGPVFFFFFHY